MPSPPLASSSAVAGPSRPRGSLPARTTRRQAHEQSELLANVITPMAGNGHSTLKRSFPLEDIKAPASSLPTSTKDKTRLVEDGQRQVSNGRTPLKIRLSMGSKPLSPATDMPPPPLPSSFDSAAKRSRRATTQGVALSPLDEPETEEPMSKGKKRARISLPNLLAAKKLRGATDLVVEAQGSSSSLIEVPVQSQEPSPALTSLPSLAYFSFPPPPLRQRERSAGLRQVSYTDPTQRLPPNTQYSGEIAPIMSSYIHIEDTGPPPDLRALELRAAREAYYRNRVNYLQQKGRLLRLLDGALDDPKSANKSHHKVITGPPLRQSDHQDAMTSQMLQVRNAIVNEARMKPQVCKRVSRMVQTYWEHIEGKEDRERSAEEKEKRRKARDVARAMKKRWGLAVKVNFPPLSKN